MTTQNTPQTPKFIGSEGYYTTTGRTNVDGELRSVRVNLSLVNPTPQINRHYRIDIKDCFSGKHLNGPDDFGCTLKEAKVEALRLLEGGFGRKLEDEGSATKQVMLECALDVPVDTEQGDVVAVMLTAADWDVLRALIATNPAIEAQMKAAGIMKTEIFLDL